MRITKSLLAKCAVLFGLLLTGGCASESPYGYERPPFSELMSSHWQKEQDQMDAWKEFGRE